ncbi:hypothetical protein [Desulfonema magnum]|uniref:PglD N-terminal domain-containing protein n=1 Tax=Desulfonema magnum TaxID=45655 RepID=A0A975GU06_9BACT|nr:hypothetical protein [Desulfonema magnum]QTA93611.1 PglD N-terminal domain-containing protein [Desulfonema magnum]
MKKDIINTKKLIEHGSVIEEHIATNAVINGEVRNWQTLHYRGACNAESVFLPSIENPIKIGVFGVSGFSRESVDIILCDCIDELIYVDLAPDDSMYFGFPAVPEEKIPQLVKEGYSFVIGLGDNKTRKKIYERYKHLSFPNIIHPTASLGYKQLEILKKRKGNIITAGVRITNNIVMGDFGIYNLNSTVGHDCIIENFINLAPGANISGNVILKEGAYIGTNAAILQGKSIEKKLEIGEFSTVGAGSVVTKHIDAFTTVVGIPAKLITKH